MIVVDARTTIPSPLGLLTVSVRHGAVAAIGWPESPSHAPPSLGTDDPVLIEACRQLDAYFAGTLDRFTVKLAPAGSDFQRRVWVRMNAIPYGHVHRYGDLARDLDTAARAVGGACGRNPIPIVQPCHRVVGGSGYGGFSAPGGLAVKAWLLAHEREHGCARVPGQGDKPAGPGLS